MEPGVKSVCRMGDPGSSFLPLGRGGGWGGGGGGAGGSACSHLLLVTNVAKAETESVVLQGTTAAALQG